ncbi:MAG: hypothetical protein CFE26_06335 [Verrucomicrobiales bacterium VVV1]|nr:MAG: hypothetical protein CFE26_06335 [Verrucomicrobiales bacterium VVV1]
MLSLLASLVLNGLLFFSFSVIASKRVSVVLQPKPEPALEQVVSIMVMPEKGSAGEAQSRPVVPVPPRPDQFARTSEDQASARPEKPAFIGERDTEATSDRAPDPTAVAMPSQKGIDPVQSEVETTESRYQDGEIGDSGKTKPSEPVAEITPPAPGIPSTESPPAVEAPAGQDTKPGPESMPVVREQLAQGPNPVDVPVQADPNNEEPKPTPAGRSTEAELPKPPTPLKEAVQDKPKEAAVAEKAPGFKGYQRKTQIRGSISRTGKSALAVENSAMGRYQATLSRAVELEWQRNCVRYRDYITPGFLTVRFVVEQNGKVRSTGFVGAMQTNEIQKGFTLNAIRQAAIPAMPADLKKELGSEPLELIFNFYF